MTTGADLERRFGAVPRAESDTCANCQYWQRGRFEARPEPHWVEEGEMGDCRRDAPKATDGFPFTWSFFWCGDHKLKADPNSPMPF